MEKIEILKYRQHEDDRSWTLPWRNHPITQGVMPLFMTVDDYYHPIGTAFFVGSPYPFLLTAVHCVDVAVKEDPRLERLLVSGPLQGNYDLKRAALSILQIRSDGHKGQFTFWPIETFTGSPPGDVLFGVGAAINGQPFGRCRISFTPPFPGETLLSVGYEFDGKIRESGIPRNAVIDGSFDWNEFNPRLVVSRGEVAAIFSQRFAHGFVAGPCFAFSADVRHGMSGGPIFNSKGDVCGINSASAAHWFAETMSLGSLLYMLILSEITFGFYLGSNRTGRINRKSRILELIADGQIWSDGSEEEIGFSEGYEDEDGNRKPMVHGKFDSEHRNSLFEDFQAFQEKRPPEPFHGPITRIRYDQDPDSDVK